MNLLYNPRDSVKPAGGSSSSVYIADLEVQKATWCIHIVRVTRFKSHMQMLSSNYCNSKSSKPATAAANCFAAIQANITKTLQKILNQERHGITRMLGLQFVRKKKPLVFRHNSYSALLRRLSVRFTTLE
ncbi:hypothetical protein C5167_020365 [Papaver somniferum]|uniref:Uncharacterized protein n=1 Tax=Papaver somniferum TaxID=3469 RepID=A0A4Y7IWQ5_PAPSO|nr:hypothetical protein C5167_020365 [Papaver somniferum]